MAFHVNGFLYLEKCQEKKWRNEERRITHTHTQKKNERMQKSFPLSGFDPKIRKNIKKNFLFLLKTNIDPPESCLNIWPRQL